MLAPGALAQALDIPSTRGSSHPFFGFGARTSHSKRTQPQAQQTGYQAVPRSTCFIRATGVAAQLGRVQGGDVEDDIVADTHTYGVMVSSR